MAEQHTPQRVSPSRRRAVALALLDADASTANNARRTQIAAGEHATRGYGHQGNRRREGTTGDRSQEVPAGEAFNTGDGYWTFP